jgi:hypothetical protein
LYRGEEGKGRERRYCAVWKGQIVFLKRRDDSSWMMR